MTENDRIVPFPSPRQAGNCPICGKATVRQHRPFCSRRCADIDLGRWLKGSYRVPTEERPDPFEAPAEETE